MTKQYIDVPGFEGLYLVSNDGSVYSYRSGKEMKPRKHAKSNLFEATLTDKNGKHKVVSVHRLMLESWVGPAPEGHIAKAKNGDLCDLRLANLEWCPKSEVYSTNRGSRHKEAHLTDEQALEIKRRLSGKVPRGLVAEIAREFDVPHETVRKIHKGESYKWLVVESVG